MGWYKMKRRPGNDPATIASRPRVRVLIDELLFRLDGVGRGGPT
jgi:hypothetical protein